MDRSKEDRAHRRRQHRRRAGGARGTSRARRRAPVDIPDKEGVAKGKALDISQAGALDGYDAKITGTSNYADIAGADGLHRHGRRSAQARHEPRRPARDQPQDHPRGLGGHQAERARRVRHRDLEPARRDGLRAPRADGLPARARRRHGRRARQRAHDLLPRGRARCEPEGREHAGARRARRLDGSRD